MDRSQKQPKCSANPHQHDIRQASFPESHLQQTPAWQFHLCDREHPLWGWDTLGEQGIISLLRQQLQSFESMTWSEIDRVSGGRIVGTNHHSLTVDGFTKGARDRLDEIFKGKIEELFSLRINNTVRIYGIREGRVLKRIWHDPHHGTNNDSFTDHLGQQAMPVGFSLCVEWARHPFPFFHPCAFNLVSA
ncbi:MAG: hypothetical protein HQM04_10070 [Magnetococcales bacterium]|nr:hypothetical protein [Magnetococcales bacterium]MBF0115377.1 hypothetical protein [Magnetococcales bacterium]